jgi:hypothetical protein
MYNFLQKTRLQDQTHVKSIQHTILRELQVLVLLLNIQPCKVLQDLDLISFNMQ